MDLLSEEQKTITKQALGFYAGLEDIIKNGQTKIYGNRGRNTRYPTGTQIVCRKTDRQMLVVCHAFQNPGGEVRIPIEKGYCIKDSFFAESVTLDGEELIVAPMQSLTAGAVILEKTKGENENGTAMV